jgi:hypothetical protein
MVLETRGGVERFDFSSQPPNSTTDNSPCSQRPVAKQSAKRRPNARKREWEKQRRIAWVERRKKHAKGTGCPAPADMATGSKAAAAVASKAAAAAATAAVTTAATTGQQQQLTQQQQHLQQQLRPATVKPLKQRCHQQQLLELQQKQQQQHA